MQERDIPVLIFSAGLADIIEEVSLTKSILVIEEVVLLQNMHISLHLLCFCINFVFFFFPGPEANSSQIFQEC